MYFIFIFQFKSRNSHELLFAKPETKENHRKVYGNVWTFSRLRRIFTLQSIPITCSFIINFDSLPRALGPNRGRFPSENRYFEGPE